MSRGKYVVQLDMSDEDIVAYCTQCDWAAGPFVVYAQAVPARSRHALRHKHEQSPEWKEANSC